MSPHDEEDFELVLGNRQLFFLAVVLFGVFFSIGYTVGYGRGSDSADEVAAATDPASPATELAQSLPPDASTPAAGEPRPAKTQTVAARATGADSGSGLASAESKPESQAPAPKQAVVARNTPAAPPPSSKPSRASTAPSTKTRAESASPRTSSASSAPGRPRSKPASGAAPPTVSVPAIVPGSIYLQVAASTEAGPARQVLLDMKSKGHPVAMDNIDPAWFRILVGPFATKEAAAEYQLKLTEQKIESFIRKL